MASSSQDVTLLFGAWSQGDEAVHEAYIKLVEQDHAEWNGRAHFTAVAAKYMRQILMEDARKRDAAKRGYGERPVSLDESIAFAPQRPAELLALDEAMEELAACQHRRQTSAGRAGMAADPIDINFRWRVYVFERLSAFNWKGCPSWVPCQCAFLLGDGVTGTIP
jgi:ECF sigma factor